MHAKEVKACGKGSARKDDGPLAQDRSADIAKMELPKMRLGLPPKDSALALRMPAVMVENAKKLAKRKGAKDQARMREAIADFPVKEGE